MKRNRRSFLKAALGCATALVVPGALLTEKKYQNPIFTPGIWAMPKGGATGIVSTVKPDGLLLMLADPPYMLKFKEQKAFRKTPTGWEEINWNDVVSSKRY